MTIWVEAVSQIKSPHDFTIIIDFINAAHYSWKDNGRLGNNPDSFIYILSLPCSFTYPVLLIKFRIMCNNR
jgi:hypothetical protein